MRAVSAFICAIMLLVSSPYGALRARHCQFDKHIYRDLDHHAELVRSYVAGKTAEYVSGDTSFFLIERPGSEGHILVLGTDTPTVSVGTIGAEGDTTWVLDDSVLIRDKHGDATKFLPHFKGDSVVAGVGNLESGVWDDYDSATGYDQVPAASVAPPAVSPITADGKSFVDNEFWIDSIGDITDEPAWVPSYVVDTGVALGGYMIMAFGQIRIDAAGEYVFVRSGRYDGTQVWFDFDSDNTWDAIEWEHIDEQYLRDTLGLDIGGRRLYKATVSLQPGHYRLKMYFWQWGDQRAASYLAWKRPDAANAVIVPSSAFGDPKAAPVPMANVAAMLKNGVALSSGDSTTTCAADTFTFVGELLYAPDGASPVYHWDFGDGTTRETTTDTVTHVYTTAGKRWTRLFITYGGEYPTRSASSYSVRVRDCEVRAIRPAGSASADKATLRMRGGRLFAHASGRTPLELFVFDLQGRALYAATGRTRGESFVLDLRSAGLGAGAYIATLRCPGREAGRVGLRVE